MRSVGFTTFASFARLPLHSARFQARSASLVLRLELQSLFPSGFGYSGNPSVIDVATTIEYDRFDALGLRALGNQSTDALRRFSVPGLLQIFQLGIQRAGGNQCFGLGIVHDLHVDVLVRTINAQSWSFGGADKAAANSHMPFNPRVFSIWLGDHFLL